MAKSFVGVCGDAWVTPKSPCCEGWSQTERGNNTWGNEENN